MQTRWLWFFCSGCWLIWVGLYACPIPQPPAEHVVSDSAEPDTPEAPPVPTQPTWHQHVQPLFAQYCGSCHQNGGIGPFPLMQYEDIKARKAAIQWSIENRRMPPWSPSQDCQSFQHQRTLSPYAQQTLQQWFAQDIPEGTGQGTPVPVPPSLPWVDRTVTMSKPFPLDFANGDLYQCFALDPKLDRDVDLIGFHFVPGARANVHHVLLFQLLPQEFEGKERIPGAGWPCFGGPGGSGRLLGAWVPGSGAVQFPTNTGISMQKGMQIVLQIHYAPTAAAPSPDQSSLQLQFAKSPVAKRAAYYIVKDDQFAIPPKATGHTITNISHAPGTKTIWGVMPHMHAKGANFKVELIHPNQQRTCLIEILKWDANWQQTYFFRTSTGISMQPTDMISLSCGWNNPSEQTVKWGDTANDEMCVNYFYVTD